MKDVPLIEHSDDAIVRVSLAAGVELARRITAVKWPALARCRSRYGPPFDNAQVTTLEVGSAAMLTTFA